VSALTLNIKNGFSFVFPTGKELSPPSADKVFNRDLTCIVHRVIASGGTPPYRYVIEGQNQSYLTFLNFENRPGIGWYHEYADLTIKTLSTLDVAMAKTYPVTIQVEDFAGDKVRCIGDVVIARNVPIITLKEKVVNGLETSQLYYSKVDTVPLGSSKELTQGYYRTLDTDLDVNFAFDASYYKGKLNLIVLNKPRGLALSRPVDTENLWLLNGKTSFTRSKLTYLSYYLVELVGSTSIKHPIVSFPYYQKAAAR
jgi:hypothetical protein